MLKLVRDQILTLSKSRNGFRNLETASSTDQPLKKRGKKKKETIKPSSIQGTKITEHLSSNGLSSIIDEFPQKIKKATCSSESLYLSDVTAAEQFSALIQEDIVQGSSSFVAEINPGLGLLTEKLVQTKVPKIHLYEPTPLFSLPDSRLQSIISKHPDRLELRKANLLKLWGVAFLDIKDGGNRFQEMLQGIEKRKWEEEPYMKIVGAIANNKLIRQLMMSVIFQNSYVAWGRVNLYVAMPPSDWMRLTAEVTANYYKSRPVLFQSFFDYEKLGVLPRKAFLPRKAPLPEDKRLTSVQVEFHKLDEDSLYVVRIEPKANILSGKFKKEDFLRFFFFVRHHLQIKQTRIIPAMEKWVPNCGPRLIAKNLNIYSEFQQLTPKELLELYFEFSSWPEFETSHFLDIMASYVNSIEEGIGQVDQKYIMI